MNNFSLLNLMHEHHLVNQGLKYSECPTGLQSKKLLNSLLFKTAIEQISATLKSLCR